MGWLTNSAVMERDDVLALAECPEVRAAREEATRARQAHAEADARYKEVSGLVNRATLPDSSPVSREDFLRARRDLPAAELAASNAELDLADAAAKVARVTEPAVAQIRAARLPGRKERIAEILAALQQVQDANIALGDFDRETERLTEQPVAFAGFAFAMPSTDRWDGMIDAWARAMRSEGLLD